MSETSFGPAEWRRPANARQVHVAGPNYEQLLAEAKSNRELAGTPPELHGYPGPHHLADIEKNEQFIALKARFEPSEREMHLGDELRELDKLIEENPSFRLQNHWDKVQDMERELEWLAAHRRSAWREELRPLLQSRIDDLSRLPFIRSQGYRPDLARHPSVAVRQQVNLDRIVYVGRLGTDWSGRFAGGPKRAEGGRRQGEALGSDQYILEIALDIAVGELDPDTLDRDLPECIPVTLPDGELGFTVNGGSHRVAAMELLGRGEATCLVIWPA